MVLEQVLECDIRPVQQLPGAWHLELEVFDQFLVLLSLKVEVVIRYVIYELCFAKHHLLLAWLPHGDLAVQDCVELVSHLA